MCENLKSSPQKLEEEATMEILNLLQRYNTAKF